jgi:DNA gyrase/topoisomerase IV subunit A
MMLFDAEGKIKRYETPEQILEEFYELRLDYYHRRKAALLKVLNEYYSHYALHTTVGTHLRLLYTS